MTDEATNVPTAQKSGWTSFLKSLASFSGDLSGLTAPPFILSPTSLSEFPSYWGEPKDLFAAIADGTTPGDRQLRVTRWFLATLSGQFTRREKETGSEKKPLNPFLGEQFLGDWDNGELVLTVEQVSHHPPITAYRLENKKKGIVWEGNCAQKTSFSARMISVKQVGHGLLRLKPIEQQNEFESRRAWKAVADGIRNGDYDAASVAKGTLENSERQKRKDEQAGADEPFQLRLFDYVENDPDYARLAALLKFKPETEDSWVLKPSAGR